MPNRDPSIEDAIENLIMRLQVERPGANSPAAAVYATCISLLQQAHALYLVYVIGVRL